MVSNKFAGNKKQMQWQDKFFALLIWLGYTALLLSVALPDGWATFINYGSPFPIDSLPPKLGGDAGYYIEGANELLQKGWFGAYWFFNLWTPGFFWLEAIIIRTVGIVNLLPTLLIATSAAWSLVFVLLWLEVKDALRFWSFLWLPLPFLALDFFRNYFLRDGVLMSETISSALWFIAVLVLVKASEKRAWPGGLLGGAILACAAYIRGNLELAAMLGTLSVILLAIANGFSLLVRKKVLIPKKLLLVLLAAVVAFHSLTIPWRLRNYAVRKDFQWQRIDYYWELLFTSDADMATKSYITAGVPVAYYCAPALSDKLRAENKAKPGSVNFQHKAIEVFVHHPFKWLNYKQNKSLPFWLESSVGREAVNIIIACFGLFAFVALFICRRQSGNAVLLALYLCVFIAQLIACTFVHSEARYFYFLKCQMIIVAISGLAALCRRTESSEDAAESLA